MLEMYRPLLMGWTYGAALYLLLDSVVYLVAKVRCWSVAWRRAHA